ncbi:MAG: DUF192 domain-containing protein [Candidatus Micrarchaeota archaeon]|nr:DUF192 domain-containing protein [Candidatus Micrarchaeota archaeon]
MKGALPVVILVLGMLFVVYHNLSQQHAAPSYSSFTISNKTFAITYVAANESSWRTGLMNKTITNSTTMLFVFPNLGIYPFWMFDTYSNLDMIWINGSLTSGKIVYIAANATSCFNENSCTIYNPNRFANFVIEAKEGFVKRNNVSLGQMVFFR